MARTLFSSTGNVRSPYGPIDINQKIARPTGGYSSISHILYQWTGHKLASMPETGSTASTFFLPVLILVIVQFAKVAREADLTTIVKEEHPPLLISPITSILFAIIRGITWGLFTSLVVKLVSDSIEARLQSIFYERLRPLLEPIHSIQREALDRITGSDIKDESERIQFLLHFRRLRPEFYRLCR